MFSRLFDVRLLNNKEFNVTVFSPVNIAAVASTTRSVDFTLFKITRESEYMYIDFSVLFPLKTTSPSCEINKSPISGMFTA